MIKIQFNKLKAKKIEIQISQVFGEYCWADWSQISKSLEKSEGANLI